MNTWTHDLDLGQFTEQMLIFGGPYSNLAATEAMRQRSKELHIPPERIICTGDVVAYCSEPQETVQVIRDWGITVVQGNCEESLGAYAPNCGCGFEDETTCSLLSVDWYEYASKKINEHDKAWMRSLPKSLRFDFAGHNVVIIHGGVLQNNQFIFPSTSEDIKQNQLDLADCQILIGGHSGIPFGQKIDNRAILNPGVIGLPANDGTQNGWYLLLSPKDNNIEFSWHKLQYNADQSCQNMIASSLNRSYAKTLLNGLWPSMDVLPKAEENKQGHSLKLPNLILGQIRNDNINDRDRSNLPQIDSNESSCYGPASRVLAPGFIQATKLNEVWFHTGTQCNLSCPGCLEGSGPGVGRIETLHFEDAKTLIDEAVELGVKHISFTGGEPFVNKDFMKILDYTLDKSDCLVLTNGTAPTIKNFDEIIKLKDKPSELHFRISLDSPHIHSHEKIRGKGSFQLSLDTLRKLHNAGFKVSVARRSSIGENSSAVLGSYKTLFLENGIPQTLQMVAFSELLAPDAHPRGLPKITVGSLVLHDLENPFMCEFSRMVLKKDGKTRVYSCTLVDDDEGYDMGSTLSETLNSDIHLTHHRCFSCYSQGASCSEL